MKTERPATMESSVKKMEELRAKNKLPKSKVAQRVDWFIAPAAAIISFLIVETRTWPAPWLREFFGELRMRGDLFVFLPIGIAVMILLIPIRVLLLNRLEKKYGKSSEKFSDTEKNN